MWHADRNAYSSGHLVPSHLRLAYVLLVETNIVPDLSSFLSGLCSSNTPRYWYFCFGLVYVLLVETNLFPEVVIIFPDYALRKPLRYWYFCFGLAYVLLVETNIFPEVVIIFSDYALRTSLGSFALDLHMLYLLQTSPKPCLINYATCICSTC